MYCPACGHQNEPGSETCSNCMLSLAHLDQPALHDRVQRSLMTEMVATLSPRQANLESAIRQMIDRAVGAVLVVDSAGALVGILTERDFLTKVAGQPRFEALAVREFMTAGPETVAPTDSLAFALGRMDAGGYRHLPVVADGMPVGVISVRDILRHVTHLCQAN